MFYKVNSFRFWVCSSVACLLYCSPGSTTRGRRAATRALGLGLAAAFGLPALGLRLSTFAALSRAGGAGGTTAFPNPNLKASCYRACCATAYALL